MSENIQFMFRDCYKYGISFIITSIATNALRYRSQQYFETKVLMQLGDPMEYRSILDADRGFAPASIFGRGAIKINDNAIKLPLWMKTPIRTNKKKSKYFLSTRKT